MATTASLMAMGETKATAAYFDDVERRLRRQIEEVETEYLSSQTKGEEEVSFGAFGQVRSVRAEISAAISEANAVLENREVVLSREEYDRLREKIQHELASCEQRVDRLSSACEAVEAIEEAEAHSATNEFISAVDLLSKVEPLLAESSDDIKFKEIQTSARRRAATASASVQSRLIELLCLSIDASPSQLTILEVFTGLLRGAPVDGHEAQPAVALELATRLTARRNSGIQFRLSDRISIFLDALLSAEDDRSIAVEANSLRFIGTNTSSCTLDHVLRRIFLLIQFLKQRLYRENHDALQRALQALDISPRLTTLAKKLPWTGSKNCLQDLQPYIDLPIDHLSQAVDAFVQDRAATFLDQTRELLLGDWHNYTEIDLGNEVLKSPDPEDDDLFACTTTKKEEDSDDQAPTKLHVSLLAQTFVQNIKSLLQEALTASSPNAAVGLYHAARRGFELYRTLFVLQHGTTIDAVPTMTTVFHHDCLFLARAAVDLSLSVSPKLQSHFFPGGGSDTSQDEQAFFTFADQIQPFRDLASKYEPPPSRA